MRSPARCVRCQLEGQDGGCSAGRIWVKMLMGEVRARPSGFPGFESSACVAGLGDLASLRAKAQTPWASALCAERALAEPNARSPARCKPNKD